MPKLRVTVFFGGFTVGGGQSVVGEIIKNIDRSQVDLTVLCYEGKANTAMEQSVERLCPITYLNEKGKITLVKMRRVFMALSATKPDVVHVHLGGMAYAVPWALLHRPPLLITAHTKPAQAFVSMVLPLIHWGLKKWKIRIAAVSKENTIMMKDYFGIDDERIVCVNNGIDIGRFYRRQHDCFTYINVARQDVNKNQAQIICCFAEIHRRNPNTRLLLIGDGPCHSELINLVEEMSLQAAVEMPGMCSDVEAYYAISDVYVQASHREALPMSVLEAMAAGLPIVSTDVGGMKDIVTRNGILVPDNDDEAMTSAMLKILEMASDEYERMKRYSRETVMEYSSENMAKKYAAIYADMKR